MGQIEAYKEAQRRIAKDPNAEHLDLQIENLATIPPEISTLTKLTRLDLRNTQITSAEPLSTLTKLTTLYLDNTQITSAEPLSTLTKLTTLYLDNTQITSAEPLSTLTKLTTLYLDNTQITSAEPLSTLTKLTTLYLRNTQISDLRPVQDLQGLASDELINGLFFQDCAATRLDPELKRLSDVEDTQTRTRDTLAYLKSLTEWPPGSALPDENPNAPRYFVPDSGPVIAVGDPVGPNDPEQQALQDECREKIRSLISTVREGDNELATLVDTAKKYRTLIDRDPENIMASTLWSIANTLRARLEAHEEAVKIGRVNDELPPLTATALKDLLATHGIFFMDHPGAAAVERKMREFLTGPRNPAAQQAASDIADTLINAPEVLDPDAAAPLAEDQAAAAGTGPSAQMGEQSLTDRVENVIAKVARKAWTALKWGTTTSAGAVISSDVLSWLAGNATLIGKYYQIVSAHYPYWLTELVKMIARSLS